jgi:hypothetical protein
MTDELIGRVIQPFGHPGIKGDLPHEDEKGDHGKPVGGEDLEDILGQEIQSGFC